MDKIDGIKRSRVMACVKSKNTAPEMRVRSTAHKLGFRYRLNIKELPGKPDIVFRSRHIALFVHGCFWHGHDCKHGRRQPTSNIDYWREKIRCNMVRDKRVQAELEHLGWTPIVIWECQTKTGDLAELLTGILSNSNSDS